jgi:hypothetical protein
LLKIALNTICHDLTDINKTETTLELIFMWSKYPPHKHYIYNTVERRITKLDEKFEYTNKYTIKLPCMLSSIQTKRVRGMVFNATFNNIAVISCLPVLLVEETGVPRENLRAVTSRWQALSHNVYRVHLAMSRIRTPELCRSYVINCGYISLKYEIFLKMLFDDKSCKLRVK